MIKNHNYLYTVELRKPPFLSRLIIKPIDGVRQLKRLIIATYRKKERKKNSLFVIGQEKVAEGRGGLELVGHTTD